jgi:hypothetical protein
MTKRPVITQFYFSYISKKLKLILKNTIIYKTLTLGERKQLNIFERKVYGRILSRVYDNGKENWRILTNKEFYAIAKKNPLYQKQ